MVTSRISYSLHCDIGHMRERVVPIHEFSRLHVDHTHESDMPTLYVAMATWIPKCNMYNDTELSPKGKEVQDVIENEDNIIQEEKDIQTEDIDTTQEDVPEEVDSNEEDKTQDKIVEIDSDSEKEQSNKDELESSMSQEDLTTPKKNNKDVKIERGSSHKKKPEEIQKAREEREKKRLEAKEAREKEKLERKEQKIKERQEKEEQRKKERLEKEEQKRKEKEEKDEQKKKEREEKEEQKRKEREEKEEQKRKEREERELKKQQELVKDKKKMEKEAAAFVNFFVPRKSAGAAELKKTEEVVSAFMPFEVKVDMRLAPHIRCNLTSEQKYSLTELIESQKEANLYLTEIKNGKSVGKGYSTWPVEENEVLLVEDTDIGECVEEQAKVSKMRAKLLKFHENKRPAYFGTWRKRSKFVNSRKPFALDKDSFDYEVDSDDDWEEEEPGESLHGSDDEEKENESDEYEVDNEFFVPHGYLSDEEAENEENVPLTPETQKEKLKMLQMEFDQEMKSKTERIKPRLIGCLWDFKLKPKIQDAISTFLQERMMIVNGPIVIKKRELTKGNKQNATNKTSTPSRKQLGKELIPDFLRMVHGNTNSRVFLINEFLNYMSSNNLETPVSKLGLSMQLKEFAKWRKCPEKGIMFDKHCWYVNDEIKKQYNLNLVLPNKWSYTNNDDNVNVKKKLNL